MHEVTREQFFAAIRDLTRRRVDVNPSIRPGHWPYASEWRDRQRRLYGITEDRVPEGSALHRTHYFLLAPAHAGPPA